ncbi:NAD(P)-dependent dehydrogenase, short-chain alcohol dehydrogenase family [Ferrithrix thermotolerans DSM 19514]|jgi:NAD(P)-dependent dehydrogenase (short-subunit alcohol dehydrogenase family)|uniref:NAD(P)-dependent dehydrogenase, short-chain alcohol dehydrogenase family n=1 Tax=Ferrithrix thermotolerans DSM 19514 TaxID=1121881 RepID=A0A1M4S5M0_9ACTN|nr:SDR family oxidoreductase [Ferrithrix thermotolerans]SHE27470.1 NAD(P)-dependent dehydrogenase, short-chain alcohol dehydrogenase family [Ferrithrix thermotolerans DSM 19514]
MDISLVGKVAVVTGGSRGIGFEIAKTFAVAGADVVIFSRREESLIKARDEILEVAPLARISYRVGNASDLDLPFSVVESVISEMGRLDILVNNAATNPHYGPILTVSKEQMEKILTVNVVSLMRWTQAVWDLHWKDGTGGTVINIASIGGMSVGSGIGFYNVSKAAVIHLTKQLAAEMGPKVRVNSIAPGLVRTDMAKVLVDSYEEALASTLPLRRIGETPDIANTALFLASSLSEWITGANLVVDGGALLV